MAQVRETHVAQIHVHGWAENQGAVAASQIVLDLLLCLI